MEGKPKTNNAEEKEEEFMEKKYEVVETPTGKMILYHHEGAEVFFFKKGSVIDSNDLEIEYKLHNLVPVDTDLLTAINKADPTFTKEYPNATPRRNERGRWDSAEFGGTYMGTDVFNVDGKGSREFGGYWWFAGVRK